MITQNGVRQARSTEVLLSERDDRAGAPIVVRRGVVLTSLALIASSLLIVDLILQTIDWELSPGWFIWPHLVRFFDLNSEASLPTWYSVSLLSGSALLTAIIAIDAWRKSHRFKWHWALLAVLVAGFSIDEGAKIHDSSAGTPLRDIIGTDGLLYYAWVIPALISALIVSLVFARFILVLPSRTRLLFILSAIVFIGGAIGFEMISGWYADRNPGPTLVYATLTSFEEFFEMCGVVLLIGGLLDYAGREVKRTAIIWNSDQGAS